MKALTQDELVQVLRKPGNVIVGIDSLTDSKARKTGNPFGTIFKRTRCVAMVGAEYGKAVNRQGEREGFKAEFVADSLPWGEWLIANKVITHKGELYLRTQTTAGMRRKRPAIVRYIGEDGNPIAREKALEYVPASKGSAKQEKCGVYGEVMVRTIKMANILRLRINGETVILVK